MELPLAPVRPIARIVRKVEVTSVNDVYYAEDPEGRAWAIKESSRSSTFADILGLELARALSIQAPRWALASTWDAVDDTASGLARRLHQKLAVEWVSDTTHWRPEAWDRIENKRDLGFLLVLDAVLGVEDRHERNLLLEPRGHHFLRAWHVRSALGHVNALVAERVTPMVLLAGAAAGRREVGDEIELLAYRCANASRLLDQDLGNP